MMSGDRCKEATKAALGRAALVSMYSNENAVSRTIISESGFLATRSW